MKAVKVILIGLLFAVVLFLSVYALFPEETAEPVIGYITPASLPASNNDASSEARSSSAGSSSRTGTSAGTSRPPKNPSSSSEKSSSESSSLESSSESEIVLWLNINTATQEEFYLLDGITEELARRIVTFRDMAGGFTSIEDLKKIPHLSSGIFDQIKDNVYCE